MQTPWPRLSRMLLLCSIGCKRRRRSDGADLANTCRRVPSTTTTWRSSSSWVSGPWWKSGYVGSQARHLTRYIQLNYPNYEIVNGQKWYPARGTTAANCFGPNPATACTSLNITRRNPNWDRVRTKTNDSNSHYDGLQLKLTGQVSAGASFTAAYTFSKVMDQQGGLNNGDNGQRDRIQRAWIRTILGTGVGTCRS